jgi:hypothetical protein
MQIGGNEARLEFPSDSKSWGFLERRICLSVEEQGIVQFVDSPVEAESSIEGHLDRLATTEFAAVFLPLDGARISIYYSPAVLTSFYFRL